LCNTTPCSLVTITYISEAHITSIFRVKEYAKQAVSAHLLHDLFLGLLFDPEDGSLMFLRSVGRLSRDYTALYPRR
jgi:hypothetical protein